MNIIPKLEKIFKFNPKKVKAAQVWIVSWRYIYDDWGHKKSLISSKGFLSEEDANMFVKSLEDAQKLLQNEYPIDIIVEKQK